MNHFRILIYCAPFKQRIWPKCATSNFWDFSQINLIFALFSRIQLCRNYALFGGNFWPKFGDGGHKNILMDRGVMPAFGHKLCLHKYKVSINVFELEMWWRILMLQIELSWSRHQCLWQTLWQCWQSGAIIWQLVGDRPWCCHIVVTDPKEDNNCHIVATDVIVIMLVLWIKKGMSCSIYVAATQQDWWGGG